VHGDDLEVVIVDEAHRFRNEDTESYELLSAICRNRIVILLTATLSATRLLISLPCSSYLSCRASRKLPWMRIGRPLFSYNADFRRLSYITRYYNAKGIKQARAEKYYKEMFDAPMPIDLGRVQRQSRYLAMEIRAVLEPVLIRRNRLDLRNDPIYASEVTELSDVADLPNYILA